MRWDDCLGRAEELTASGRRVLLGVTGPPGAGKSTLAEAVVAAVGDRAVCVPMDGFHLAQAELERLGRADRKGAPDTFDAAGYAALLRRLREREPMVYAPAFRREIEEPVAGAIGVPAAVPLVVTEGNYLLAWPAVRELLDEVWYLDLPERVRLDRLVRRHAAYGKSEADARAWAYGSDQRNADVVTAGRHLADVHVSLDG